MTADMAANVEERSEELRIGCMIVSSLCAVVSPSEVMGIMWTVTGLPVLRLIKEIPTAKGMVS